MQNSRDATVTLASLIEEKKVQLMARDSALTALEAHRAAIQAVAKEKPELVKSYRLDARS